jgi:putative PIN family toxin of toxin-antitoxin system
MSIGVVLDTNVVVASLSARSPSHWIIQELLNGSYTLAVSHDILLEYEEVLARKYSLGTALNFLSALDELPNCHKVEVFYQWHLITADPDDDKFVDASVAAGGLPLVSEDQHFRVLQLVDFPKVVVLGISEFKTLLARQKTPPKPAP